MNLLTAILDRIPEFGQLLAAVEGGACPAAVSGLAAVHRAHFAAGLRRRGERPVAVVCADELEARRLADDLSALTGEEAALLTARELTLRDAATVSRQWEHRRLGLLDRLSRGEVPLLVVTVDALLQPTIPPRPAEAGGPHPEGGGQL